MSFKEWSSGLKTPAKNSTLNKSQAVPADKQPATPQVKKVAGVTPAASRTEIDKPDEGGES